MILNDWVLSTYNNIDWAISPPLTLSRAPMKPPPQLICGTPCHFTQVRGNKGKQGKLHPCWRKRRKRTHLLTAMLPNQPYLLSESLPCCPLLLKEVSNFGLVSKAANCGLATSQLGREGGNKDMLLHLPLCHAICGSLRNEG